MYYEEITTEKLKELAGTYIETFNAEPWNDRWTPDTAEKRLRQFLGAEGSYGLCAYRDGDFCGAVLGCMEQFYDGVMFDIREFWVKNGMRGRGIGSLIFSELESRLREKGVREIILLTSRGDHTEHFYHKQGFASNNGMVFMSKRLD